MLGSRVATSWAAHRCLNFGDSCNLLGLHRLSAFPVSLLVILFVIISFTHRDVFIDQWPYLLIITILIISQIFLGHQLVACLLVAVLSALNFKGRGINRSSQSLLITESTLETCHG